MSFQIRARLSGRQAGVDWQRDACDIAGAIRRKEQYGIADVDGIDPGHGKTVIVLEQLHDVVAA